MSNYVAFTLSMPSVASWDGKWSGANRNYVIVRKFSGKAGADKAAVILNERYYSYTFGDGWTARIGVHRVNAHQANQHRRNSDGFCGYEWMVDSICKHHYITAAYEEVPANE